MTRALLRNSSLSLAIAMALSMPIVRAQDGDATEQAQTEATRCVVAGRFQPDERQKNSLAVGGGDALPVIVNCNNYPP